MSSIATILGMLIAGVFCGVVLARIARRRQRGQQGPPDEPQASPVSFDVQLPEAGRTIPHLVLSFFRSR